jgi:hypothetical protein
MTRSLRILTLAALLALALCAVAAASTTKRSVKSFPIQAGKTKTFTVSYPDALKYGGSRYSGTVKVLPPAKVKQGQMQPDLSKVKVLGKGPAQGGSVFQVRIRNSNATGTATPRVRVTAITVEP